jgi:hypothetical protein
MPSAGQWMEILPETGLRDEPNKIIVQAACQLVMSVHLKSPRQQPRAVEPRWAAPVTPWLVTGIGQIEARDTVHFRCAEPERLAGRRPDESCRYLPWQTGSTSGISPATVRSSRSRPVRASLPETAHDPHSTAVPPSLR